MYIFKPKNIKGKDDFWWFCNSDKVKEQTLPAKYGKKKTYVNEKGNKVVEYSRFHKNTNWWNLEKLFAAEKLGDSYLCIVEKIGFKSSKDDRGLFLHADGTWNCCTVLPYTEYRVVKVVAEAVKSYEGSHHNYNVSVYFEMPFFELIKYCWEESNLHRIPRAIGGVFKGIFKGAIKGWDYGWYNRLSEI